MRSIHVSTVLPHDPSTVYDYARDPAHLADWAAGLARSAVVVEGDVLTADSPMGTVCVRFAARNDLGVLDHDVTLPTGEVVANPMRVLAHPDGAEVVLTIRQRDLTDDQLAADAALVEADLRRLGERLAALGTA